MREWHENDAAHQTFGKIRSGVELLLRKSYHRMVDLEPCVRKKNANLKRGTSGKSIAVSCPSCEYVQQDQKLESRCVAGRHLQVRMVF
jgi:hypothetical protein